MNLILTEANDVLQESKAFLIEQETKVKEKDKIKKQLDAVLKELEEQTKILDDMVRAATILGNVADENTKRALDRITNIINGALDTLFPNDKKRIEVKQVMYRNVYPHFVVELETEDGTKRTFKQSGTGLAQVISFLFTLSLISMRDGRQIIVMDELLNGLHPDAKESVKAILSVVKDFQFVIVEYGVDIGKQYEVVKMNGVATVLPYQGQAYYKDIATKL